MNDQRIKTTPLYILFDTGSEGSLDDSFVFQYLERKEGIPLGRLFFWVRGVWQHDDGVIDASAKCLYQEIMGVDSFDFAFDHNMVGPFQNIEEIRRYGYLLCQKLSYTQVRLLSVDSFNSAFSLSTSKTELLERINEVSDSLENLDADKSNNFFNKILNRN